MERSVPAEVTPALCAAVGHVVVNWAFVEEILDMWSAIIFQTAGGKHVNRQMGKTLSKKVEFLRRCLKRIAALKPFADEALDCVADAKRLAKTRHFVVHGVLIHFDPANGAIIFAKLDLIDEYTMHQISELEIRLPDLIAQGSECQELAGRMATMADRLLEEFVPEDQIHKILRPVRR